MKKGLPATTQSLWLQSTAQWTEMGRPWGTDVRQHTIASLCHRERHPEVLDKVDKTSCTAPSETWRCLPQRVGRAGIDRGVDIYKEAPEGYVQGNGHSGGLWALWVTGDWGKGNWKGQWLSDTRDQLKLFFWKSGDLCKLKLEVAWCHQGPSHTAGTIMLKSVHSNGAGKLSYSMTTQVWIWELYPEHHWTSVSSYQKKYILYKF